jgi:hypothetical protein
MDGQFGINIIENEKKQIYWEIKKMSIKLSEYNINIWYCLIQCIQMQTFYLKWKQMVLYII